MIINLLFYMMYVFPFLSQKGNSLIHFAAQSGNKETFQFVRSTGVDVMAVNNVSYIYFDELMYIV